MGPLISTIFELVFIILDLFKWLLIASVVLSWLVAFNIVNTRNHAVYLIGDFVERVTGPVLRPLRRVLPNMGGLDWSPLVALLGVWFIQTLIMRYGALAL